MPGQPDKVKLGAGWLYISEYGSALPTTLAVAIDVVDPDHTPVGYTAEGSTLTFENTFEDVEVAEELEPIDSVQTTRKTRVAFAAAETTVENLEHAFNGGTITTGTGEKTFEPPDIGVVTYWTLIWTSFTGDEIWVFKKCVQQGTVEMARQKAPNKATIAMEFNVLVPDDASKPWYCILED